MADTGTVTLLTPEQGLAEFERNAGRIVNLLADADLDARIPTCPGWTLADLVGHTGGVHTWARHAIVAGTPDGPDTGPEQSDRDTLIAWYQQAATGLADVLRSTDPDAPAWTFGPRPRTARFWFRRQAHETAVHLWDAQASQAGDVNRRSEQSRPGTTVDPLVAVDGIDEVVTMFFPRQVRLGRIVPMVNSLAIEAAGQTWLLTSDQERKPEATVSGPGDAVLLLLWNRIDLGDDRLTVTGDRAAAHDVLKAGIVP